MIHFFRTSPSLLPRRVPPLISVFSPQARRGNRTLLACSVPLRSKVGGASEPSPDFCGMGPPGCLLAWCLLKDFCGNVWRFRNKSVNWQLFLYSQCNSVTEADYKVFGEQLNSMLATLKLLWQTCKRMPKASGLGNQAEKLKMNYSALYELNEDIKNYRIRAPKDKEWSSLLAQASLALKKVAYD